MNIHPTAIIGKKAELGAGVTVGPMAYIEDDVQIGNDTVIGPYAAVLRYTTLGAGCRVHAHAVLGDLPQDLAFGGEPSYVRIGKCCIIREGVTIHRGTKPETATEVGAECFLMANSHLGHNTRLADHVIVANGALMGGYVEVGSGAFISGNCLLHQFTRVGRLAMLGGGAGISKDVPPFCTVHGLQVNTVSGLNSIGLRRSGIPPEERMEIKLAFRLLYLSGMNVSQAVKKIQNELKSDAARELAEFVASSKRGVCQLSRQSAHPGENKE